MIIWDKDMRCGDGALRRLEKLKKRISHRKPAPGIYCIAIASNPSNLLDIYNANELLLPYYKRVTLHMVGLAKGREEAEQLAAGMLTEIYEKTNTFDVREYFS